MTATDSLNQWKLPKPLKVRLESEKRHDATVQVYDKGKRMISYHDGQLFISEKIDSVWHRPKRLRLHDMPGDETHCFITEDEQQIFFLSDYMNGGANLDLYTSTMNADGLGGEPIPMDTLTTSYDEDSPFLAENGSFYFSSRGHQSIRGYDVFKSNYNEKTGTWSPPVGLEYPINTA